METDRKPFASLPYAPPPAPPPPNEPNNAFPRVRPMHGRTSGPTRRSTRGQWTPEEDEILCNAVQRFKGKNWKKIAAECFKDRTDVQCLHRWQKVLNPDLIKGPWSKEEDDIIVQLVAKYGPKKWSTIAQHLPGRIGKQCRERWHNHLNPAINKEAWTQEEELVLIRAHQEYGNRWAELTKYLPGRTDNAIKNHWNSSVKKKLDSYIASGMLAHLPSLPSVSLQNQTIPGASLQVHHSSGDGSICKGGVDAEGSSECSQVGCSQTASDMSNTACRTEEYLFSEGSDHGRVQITSPTGSFSGQYYTSLDDITFTIPDIPCEFSCSPKHFDENFSKDCGNYTDRDTNLLAVSLQDTAIDLAADTSNQSGNHLLGDKKHGGDHGPSRQPSGCSGQESKAGGSCSEVPDPQEGIVGYHSFANHTKGSGIIDMDKYRDSLVYQSTALASDEVGTVALHECSTQNATVGNGQNLSSAPSEVLEENNADICTMEHNFTASEVQEVVRNVGPSHTHNYSTSPCHDRIAVEDLSDQIQLDLAKLVPVNAFGSETLDGQQNYTCEVVEVEPITEQEAGTLCYEPPRFPSLDIPFLSCDLAHSGADPLYEFSPLGIRNLMMSSMNVITPFKLWDSPSSDDSPDAVLKSAAKTFGRTPSILKKRHRELSSPLSPFSERRCDKKIVDVNQGSACTSRLTKEFSRLDVMFNEVGGNKESSLPSCNQSTNSEPSLEDKENICPTFDMQIGEANHEDNKKSSLPSCDQSTNSKPSIKDKENICPPFFMQTEEANHEDNSGNDISMEVANKYTMKNTEGVGHDPTILVNEDHVTETQPRGVLLDRQLNDTQFSSPDVAKPVLKSRDGTSDIHQKSKNTSEKIVTTESVNNKLEAFANPRPLNVKNDFALSYGQSASSAMADTLVNEVGAENLNIFGGTPYRRSIESPSAWKSPWYFNSLVPYPRFDADLMQDLSLFMSPGERGIDALGLMKQINEQSADAYADAREVLGSDTPESILKQRSLRNQDQTKPANNAAGDNNEGRLRLASTVSTERRMLDFSECGSPKKLMEKGKCVDSTSLSSPLGSKTSYR